MDDIKDFFEEAGINPEVHEIITGTLVNSKVENSIFKANIDYPDTDVYDARCVVHEDKIEIIYSGGDVEDLTLKMDLKFSIDEELAQVEHNNKIITVEAPITE